MAGDHLLGGAALVTGLARAGLVEGHDVLVGTDEIAPFAEVANANVAVAVVGYVDLQGGSAAGHKVGVNANAGLVGVGGNGAMEDGGVGRVDAALQGLEPVAFLPILGDFAVGFRYGCPFKVGRRRRLATLFAHVGPDHAAPLDGRVGLDSDLGVEVAVRRFVHHVQAIAVHVELPAVINAAQATSLVAAEEKGSQSVGAVLVQQSHLAIGVPEGDQILAQQPDSHRGTVGFGQFRGEQGGHPVAAHDFAHGRALAGPGQDFIVGVG